jgi:hypothetical protein
MHSWSTLFVLAQFRSGLDHLLLEERASPGSDPVLLVFF